MTDQKEDKQLKFDFMKKESSEIKKCNNCKCSKSCDA